MHKHIKEIKQMTTMLEKGYPIEGMVQYRRIPNIPEWKNCTGFARWEDFNEYSVALARVEDKYAHLGDIVYHKKYGDKREVVPGLFDFETEDKWSWPPPKPAIVMVPLLREDAEYLSSQNSLKDGTWARIEKACKEALK
jgi:hypothetical protein